MQALEVLAEEHETIEEPMQKVTYETEESDILFAVAYETMKELDKAQKDQDSLQDELEATVGHSTMSCVPISAKRPSNSAMPEDRSTQTQSQRCPRQHPVLQGAMSTSSEGTCELRKRQRHTLSDLWSL